MAMSYQQVWQDAYDLDALNVRLHDGVPLDHLADRGRSYRDLMFQRFYPLAAPRPGDRVLEIGGGVGWIMQAVLEGYPGISELVDLDISENMIRRAQERWSHPKVRYQLYDGLTFPFPDDSFDVVYSCACIQHIEKHAAYFVFKEAHRVLKPGGHAVLHLLSIHQLPRPNNYTYEEECRHHLEGRGDHHWHHYYGLDELVAMLAMEIGVSDFDLQVQEGETHQFVHFSKRTGQRFLDADLLQLMYPQSLTLLAERDEALAAVARAQATIEEMRATRRWRFAEALRRTARRRWSR
ncbi:MAG TPA: class I SAM-dependent methyltransferase [Candidatus Dormibacteraeota bacterium]|nr:class I SAM-dependent methyltransferase [Candidatus Dormibacteraeota bacterium]